MTVTPVNPTAASVRWTQRTLLLRVTARLMPWSPVVVGAVVAMALSLDARLDRPDDDIVSLIRLAGLLVVSGAAFALDDRAAEVAGATTTTLRTRYATRAVVVVPAVVLVVWASLAIAPLTNTERSMLAADLVALLAIGAAIASTTARAGSSHPGLIVAPTLLAIVLTSSRGGPLGRLPLELDSPVQAWRVAGLIATVAVVVAAIATIDPVRPLAGRRTHQR